VNLANRITISRIVLVPVFIAALLYFSPERPYFHWIALAVFLAACVSDALDGYYARKLAQKTVLGSYIDPLADKLLLVSGFLSLSLLPDIPLGMHMPAWVTIPVLSRDIIILGGSVVVYLTTGSLKPTPIYIGKVTTVVQMASLLAALALAPAGLRLVVDIVAVALTVLSGAFYIRMGGQQIARESK
jgi:cardiolipin synthase (CMP-forming)